MSCERVSLLGKNISYHSIQVPDDGDIVGASSPFRQFTALFLKQATLQVRHKWQNLFIIGVPIIMIAFTGILKLIVTQIVPNNPPKPIVADPMPFNFFDKPPLNHPTSDLHFYQQYSYTTNENQELLSTIGFRNSSGAASGMLALLSTVEFLPNNDKSNKIRVPYFKYFNTTQEMDTDVLKSLDYLSASTSREAFKKNDTFLYKLPDGSK